MNQLAKGLVDLKRMSQTQLIEYTLQLQGAIQERTPKDMKDDTTAWVSVDGSYGNNDLVVFHPESLTEDQWEFMTNIGDNDRFDYVVAVLDGDLVSVAQMYERYNK